MRVVLQSVLSRASGMRIRIPEQTRSQAGGGDVVAQPELLLQPTVATAAVAGIAATVARKRLSAFLAGVLPFVVISALFYELMCCVIELVQ